MRVCIHFILFFFPIICLAQGYSYQNYSVDDGVPQSQVSTIMQDSKGFIWLGTINGGIAKFDGKSFTVFNTKSGLASNCINYLYEDSKGKIWICTSDGIGIYNGKEFSGFGKADDFSNVNRVREFDKGIFWIADLNRGLYRVDGKTVTRFTKNEGLADNRVRDIALDNSGKYWIATKDGVSIFDGLKFTSVKKKDGLADNDVLSVLKDSKNNVWLGHNNGITKFDGKKYHIISSINGIENISILSMLEDRAGYLWFCTNEGLFRYDGVNFVPVQTSDDTKNKTTYALFEDKEQILWAGTDSRGFCKLSSTRFQHFNEKSGLPDNCVWNIIKDRKGYLWVATDNGLARYNGKYFQTFSEKDGLPDNVIYSLFEDHKGIIWIGTNRGLCRYDGHKFNHFHFQRNKDVYVYSISEDNNGNIWFCTENEVHKYDGKSTKHYILDDSITTKITSIYKDESGKLWFCSELNGVFVFDGNVFSRFNTQNVMYNNKVWSVLQDEKGNYWFAHSENGLLLYNPGNKTYDSFTVSDGLIDNAVSSITFDNDGLLWVGTNLGISCLDVKEYYQTGKKSFKNYEKLDGLDGIECNQCASYLDNEGNVWFGTIDGLTKYNPRFSINESNSKEPLLYITGLKLFLEDFSYSAWSDGINPKTNLPVNLKLPHSKNYLTFNFIGLSFINPEKIFYSYRLIGIDKTWSPASKVNHATYINLPPGKYTFEVKSCNKDGIWNSEPASFQFIIEQPFWSTWWFISLVVVIIISTILLYVKLKTVQLEKQKKELEEVVATRTKQLLEEKEKAVIANQDLEQMNETLAEANRNLAFTNLELEKLTIVTRETDNSIYIANADGNLEWINEGAVKLMGYTFEELIAAKGKNLYNISSHPSIIDIVSQCKERKKSISYESVNTTKSGIKYWAACTITPIYDKNEELKYFVIIETDITDRKMIEQELQIAYEQMEKRVEERTKELMESNELLKKEIETREWTEKELIKSKEKAEQADRLKSAFLAQMSHEIRTPVNVILSYTSLLRDDLDNKQNDELKPFFYGISSAGKRLIRTIDMILNMSEIQTGTFDLSIREISLEEVLSKLVVEFRSLAKDKDLLLNFNKLTDETNIFADEYTIEQIFQNLINNAIKYTQIGSIDISIYKDEAFKICVDIKDSGIGISEEFLQNIFQPFTQEEIGYTRKYEGNGLGLALVKNYIDMNNAEIFVKSMKGEGSTFTVKFKGD